MNPDELLEKARTAFEQHDYGMAAAFYSDLDEYLDGGGALPRRWELMQQEKRRGEQN